jgi:hypothetical protein
LHSLQLAGVVLIGFTAPKLGGDHIQLHEPLFHFYRAGESEFGQIETAGNVDGIVRGFERAGAAPGGRVGFLCSATNADRMFCHTRKNASERRVALPTIARSTIAVPAD